MFGIYLPAWFASFIIIIIITIIMIIIIVIIVIIIILIIIIIIVIIIIQRHNHAGNNLVQTQSLDSSKQFFVRTFRPDLCRSLWDFGQQILP